MNLGAMVLDWPNWKLIKLIGYFLNKATEAQVAEHLLGCDADFVTPLTDRVDIGAYAKKIVNKATCFEAWSNDRLIGLIAAYCNDQEAHIAYITSVSVLNGWTGQGIATTLMKQCITTMESLKMGQIKLEVFKHNASAHRLYEKSGFIANEMSQSFVSMTLNLKLK